MASYSTLLIRTAATELESVPTTDRQRLVNTIGALADTLGPVGAGKLRSDDRHRVRQGDERIIYETVDVRLIVTVVRIGNRREATAERRSGACA